MGIKELITKLKGGNNKKHITWRIDPYEGLDFIFSQEAQVDSGEVATANPLFGLQLAYLKSLQEQGYADSNANGFTIKSDRVPDLDDYFFELFDLPEPYTGRYQTLIDGNTSQASFSVRLKLLLPDGAQLTSFELYGPFLKLAENELYRLSPAEWKAIWAVENHSNLPRENRGEYENNWLIFQLQIAKKAGMDIDLAHFNNLELAFPEVVGVAVEQTQNGDLILTPSFGPGFNLDDIKSRLGQIDEDAGHCILRVKNKFVLLDEDRLKASHEILTNRRIPKSQVETFLKSPTAYLNSALIDLDTGFSLRVHGAERFTHKYFGEVEKSGIGWFDRIEATIEPIGGISSLIDLESAVDELENKIAHARKNGADVLEYQGRAFDISDVEAVNDTIEQAKKRARSGDFKPEDAGQVEEQPDTQKLEAAVIAIDANDEAEEFVEDVCIDSVELSRQNFRLDNLKRQPFPHQDEGIRWLLAHLEIAQNSRYGSGALLADDMGLGKTYMTLVAIAEWYQRCRDNELTQKPVMIVAPLSLIENWQAEVEQTFYKSPFTDIVVLQSGAELTQYRIKGAGRETQQQFGENDRITEQDEIRYSLKVGKAYGSERLDLPGRMVLTTYQTLRDYQFSLSRIDWSIVAFDEAQNIKNPNALATRAAKGLKADFKLLATGTPVENSLKDFWCLFDTAVPGLLGAWQSFRKEYIAPITTANDQDVRKIKSDIGKRLREKVSDYMLRRTKEEKLGGLPPKRLYSGDKNFQGAHHLDVLGREMSGAQLRQYDEIVSGVHNSSEEDKRKIILPSLMGLKITSIHHELVGKPKIQELTGRLIKEARASCKISAMLDILQEIQARNEKVLIFTTTKIVQAYVSTLVSNLFGIPVDIINGETKAVSNKKSVETRKGIIDRFQQQPGFGVLVMSPVAAGVGLTVVEANNVIHLERHWNPAKEAQATDRVYRIGQKKEVNVYIPMALHPHQSSFDVQLNSLLTNKIDLSDAVVAPEEVKETDFANLF